MEADMLASLKNKEKYSRYFGSLKYALYVITHPLDGFWDLTHEKRGSIAAANTIVILTVLARIMSLQFTSFLFMQVYSFYILQVFFFHWRCFALETGDLPHCLMEREDCHRFIWEQLMR